MDFAQCACSGRTLAKILRPAVLALLASEETHGYDIVRRLQGTELFADAPPDISGVYKMLKSMEEEGLVSTAWDLGDKGPAKRRYALTKDGKACLRRWAETLAAYRAQIDGLLVILHTAGDPSRKGRKRGAAIRTRCRCASAMTQSQARKRVEATPHA
jgi:DNA-binding PadR family transcriptional regulator